MQVCQKKLLTYIHFTLIVVLVGRSCNLPFIIITILDWSRSVSFLLSLCEPLSPGHRSWQMAETREDDLRGPGWELQVRLFYCMLTLFIFLCKNLTEHSICSNTREWETAKRTTRQVNAASDGEQLGGELWPLWILQGGSRSLALPAGVGIIALLKRTLHKDCVVMVKQFRPPLGCYTLEFPAGQMLKRCFAVQPTHGSLKRLDFGGVLKPLTFSMKTFCSGLMDEGESAEVAALRELKEETGYKGEVVGVTPGISSPCWLLSDVLHSFSWNTAFLQMRLTAPPSSGSSSDLLGPWNVQLHHPHCCGQHQWRRVGEHQPVTAARWVVSFSFCHSEDLCSCLSFNAVHSRGAAFWSSVIHNLSKSEKK